MANWLRLFLHKVNPPCGLQRRRKCRFDIGTEIQQPLEVVNEGKLDAVAIKYALQAFSAACWQWKQAVSSDFPAARQSSALVRFAVGFEQPREGYVAVMLHTGRSLLQCRGDEGRLRPAPIGHFAGRIDHNLRVNCQRQVG